MKFQTVNATSFILLNTLTIVVRIELNIPLTLVHSCVATLTTVVLIAFQISAILYLIMKKILNTFPLNCANLRTAIAIKSEMICITLSLRPFHTPVTSPNIPLKIPTTNDQSILNLFIMLCAIKITTFNIPLIKARVRSANNPIALSNTCLTPSKTFFQSPVKIPENTLTSPKMTSRPLLIIALITFHTVVIIVLTKLNVILNCVITCGSIVLIVVNITLNANKTTVLIMLKTLIIALPSCSPSDFQKSFSLPIISPKKLEILLNALFRLSLSWWN